MEDAIKVKLNSRTFYVKAARDQNLLNFSF